MRIISTLMEGSGCKSNIAPTSRTRFPYPSGRSGTRPSPTRAVSGRGLRTLTVRRGGDERWLASNVRCSRQTSGPTREASAVSRFPLALRAVRHCQSRLRPERPRAAKLPIACIQSVMVGEAITRAWKRHGELSSKQLTGRFQTKRDRASNDGPLSPLPPSPWLCRPAR